MATLKKIDSQSEDQPPIYRWTELYEYYDELIGRADYSKSLSSNPFTEVHFREHDDFKSGGLREKLLREYRTNEIKDTLGISWSDWIKKPLAEIEWEQKINLSISRDMARIAGNNSSPGNDPNKSGQPNQVQPKKNDNYTGHRRI